MPATRPILMCSPDHFDVAYAINPWMSVERRVDRPLAARQWGDLRARLSEHVSVEVIPPQPGLPDMVFTANAGAISDTCVVPSRFVPRERRAEEAHFKAWFRERGFKVSELADDIGFEGAGDCLRDTRGPWFWTGYGFRTEIEAHPLLRSSLDAEIVSLRLIDPRFYHLDTCLVPLEGGYLMYFPAAFDSASRDTIRARVPERYRIEVSEADACSFACNAVNIGERIIVHTVSPQLQHRLEQLGFIVECVDLTEFIKAGGSAKCLTLRLG
jgi:arginine dihydrolase